MFASAGIGVLMCTMRALSIVDDCCLSTRHCHWTGTLACISVGHDVELVFCLHVRRLVCFSVWFSAMVDSS